MVSNIKLTFIIVATIIIISLLGFTGFWLERKINYALSYKSMVEETIIDSVKGECLINNNP